VLINFGTTAENRGIDSDVFNDRYRKGKAKEGHSWYDRNHFECKKLLGDRICGVLGFADVNLDCRYFVLL
jgi:hypothetical protein